MTNPTAYADVAVIAEEAGTQLLDQLHWVAMQPRIILEVGCRAGFCTQLLIKRYPHAQIFAVDTSEEMINYTAKKIPEASISLSAANKLTIEANQVDLLVANLAILKPEELESHLKEWRRVLRPEGLLIFTAYGPDTLSQLRTIIEIPQFIDMHDLGDALVSAGFGDPVLDVQHINVKFRSKEQLIQELKITEGLEIPAQASPNLELTYEIIYAHAWAPAQVVDADGTVKIPLSQLRKS